MNKLYNLSHFLEKKGIAQVLLLAFIIRFFWWLYIAVFNPDGFWLFDSYGYYNLAYNISHYGIFSRDEDFPLTPDYYRTPLYPIFIALFTFFDNTGTWICLTQVIISVCSVFFVYKISMQISDKKNIALLASFLFALDINQAMLACYILTETVFIFLLLLFINLFIKYYYSKRIKHIYYSAFILALAILCRPAATYFIFLPVLIMLILHFKNIYVFFKQSIIFLTVVLITLSPWLYRNYLVFNHVFISLIGHHDLLNYHAASVYATKNNIMLSEAQNTLRWECYNQFKANAYKQPYEYAAYIQKKSLDLIAEYPITIIGIQLKEMLKFFIKPAMGYYSEQLGLKSNYFKAPYQNNVFLKALLYLILFYQILWMLPVYMLIIIFFKKLKKPNSIYLFLILTVVYFSLLTVPPHTDVRFRSVITGILTIFAALSMFYKCIDNKSNEN